MMAIEPILLDVQLRVTVSLTATRIFDGPIVISGGRRMVNVAGDEMITVFPLHMTHL